MFVILMYFMYSTSVFVLGAGPISPNLALGIRRRPTG